MKHHADAATVLLKRLTNRHRLLILCVLGEGESSVGALNERIPLSQSALYQHLAVVHCFRRRQYAAASFTGFCPLALILDKLGVKPGAAFYRSERVN